MSDPRAPQSPSEARDEVFRLRRKLEATTDLLETAVMDYSEAEAKWSKADADAWIEVREEHPQIHGKAPLTKDVQTRVDRRCREALDEYNGARRMKDRIERQMKSLEAQLSGAQSELRSLQAELDLDRFTPSWEGTQAPPRPAHPAEVSA